MDTTKKEKSRNEETKKKLNLLEKLRLYREGPVRIMREIRKAAEEDNGIFQPPK